MKAKTIKNVFIMAGFINIVCVLLFTRFFTSSAISEASPAVMSSFGLALIIIWGLAYLAIAHNYQKSKWLIGVFALEKLMYGASWIVWLKNNDLTMLIQKDFLAGMFYALYGANDLVFFVVFVYVFCLLALNKEEV